MDGNETQVVNNVSSKSLIIKAKNGPAKCYFLELYFFIRPLFFLIRKFYEKKEPPSLKQRFAVICNFANLKKNVLLCKIFFSFVYFIFLCI